MDRFLELWIWPCMLVLCRLSGVAIFGPLLGSQAIPVKARALLAVVMAGACAPLVAGEAGNWGQPATTAAELGGWHQFPSSGAEVGGWHHFLRFPQIVPILGVEIAIGAIIGLIASIPMVAAQIGGLLCGQQLGLGFGRFYLPATDSEGDALEQMCFLLALVLFIMVGGVEQVVLAVVDSYRWLPPLPLAHDGAGLFASASAVLVGLLGGALELGLRVAAPLLAIVALESIALGFVGRTLPAINVLSVGFALRIGVGLAVLALGVGVIRMAIDGFVDETLAALRTWATGSPSMVSPGAPTP